MTNRLDQDCSLNRQKGGVLGESRGVYLVVRGRRGRRAWDVDQLVLVGFIRPEFFAAQSLELVSFLAYLVLDAA